ncbi:MAG: ABC transporter ATP-binding protein [Anaerolineae bacterium]|nr:ABC transporter ATP-binding protein [Gemmatimonadaceae bacterium]
MTPPPPALRVRSLRKSYGKVIAVDGLDLDVEPGECFGLLGPNGAGKTTTIEICEGLLQPDSGEAEILGRRWSTHTRELRERLGIALQETQLSEKLKVIETIQLFRSFYRRRGRAAEDVLALVQLQDKRDARVGTLSGGQKQRLALACALVGEPELLFLDEPTTGLDPQSRRQIWELIEALRSTGCTIVLTTHYMDEAQRLCDHVAVVDHGKVIALGTPRSLIDALGAAHTLEFASSDNHTIDVASLRKLDGVLGASEANNRYVLQVSELHLAFPALLGELNRQGIALSELHSHSATLEDVFVALTGRQLREA